MRAAHARGMTSLVRAALVFCRDSGTEILVRDYDAPQIETFTEVGMPPPAGQACAERWHGIRARRGVARDKGATRGGTGQGRDEGWRPLFPPPPPGLATRGGDDYGGSSTRVD